MRATPVATYVHKRARRRGHGVVAHACHEGSTRMPWRHGVAHAWHGGVGWHTHALTEGVAFVDSPLLGGLKVGEGGYMHKHIILCARSWACLAFAWLGLTCLDGEVWGRRGRQWPGHARHMTEAERDDGIARHLDLMTCTCTCVAHAALIYGRGRSMIACWPRRLITCAELLWAGSLNAQGSMHLQGRRQQHVFPLVNPAHRP